MTITITIPDADISRKDDMDKDFLALGIAPVLTPVSTVVYIDTHEHLAECKLADVLKTVRRYDKVVNP